MGISIVVSQIKAPHVVPASLVSTGLSSSCSASDLPAHPTGKAVEDGLNALNSATHMGDPDGAPDW